MDDAKRERLMRAKLIYDPLSGIIFRKTRKGIIRLGYRLGGYIGFKFHSQQYLAHRVAWFLQKGEWPAAIDHINGNPSDNRWENLRLTNESENALNGRTPLNNTSGRKGVCWVPEANKWRAYFRRESLGYFRTKERAIAAREKAEKGWENEKARQLAQELRGLHEGQ